MCDIHKTVMLFHFLLLHNEKLFVRSIGRSLGIVSGKDRDRLRFQNFFTFEKGIYWSKYIPHVLHFCQRKTTKKHKNL